MQIQSADSLLLSDLQEWAKKHPLPAAHHAPGHGAPVALSLGQQRVYQQRYTGGPRRLV
jgi:hypothetical protein